MKNKLWILTIFLLGTLFALESCKNSDTTVVGNWARSSDFSGATRSGAFRFTIGDNVYVGLGLGGNGGNTYLTDCWVYNPTSLSWDSIAVFPGDGRELPVAFSVNGKGYVGLGYNHNNIDQDLRYYEDFWEYDPAQNTWTQLKNFKGGRRFNALAFATDTHGYVGLGTTGDFFNDMYRYEASDDSWTKIADFPTKRQGAMSFTIDNRIYIFGGDGNGSQNVDFWEFDPNAAEGVYPYISRTQLTTNANYNDFTTAVRRSAGNAFTLNGYGYVVAGSINGTPTNITYQYDQATDTWTRMSPFEGSSRTQAVSWLTGGKAYVGTGSNGTAKFDDVWQWEPTVAYDATPN